MIKSDYHKLMLVTNRNNAPINQYLEFIKICAEAGITSLQLREKNASYGFLLELASRLQEVLSPYNIPLIINDNIHLAIELNACGVHLGQSDGDPKVAIASKKQVGISVNSYKELSNANNLNINYVGVGAIFKTLNKTDVATIWGVEGLSLLSPLSKHPIIAIGGINESNVAGVISAGASGIAVIGAIHDADNPKLAVKKLRNLIEGSNA